MSGSGPQDFTDFQRYTQSASTLLLANVNTVLAAPVNSAMFYVGSYQTLLVGLAGVRKGTSKGLFTFNFYDNQAATTLIESVNIVTSALAQGKDAIPVLGNWLQVVIQSNDYVNNHYDLTVMPTGSLITGGNGNDGTDVLGALQVAALAAAATDVSFAGFVAGRAARLAIGSTQVGLTVAVDFVPFVGGNYVLLRERVAAPDLGGAWELRLPRNPVQVSVTNTAAVAADITWSLIATQ